MKKLFLFAALLMLSFSMFFSSCSKDQVDPSANSNPGITYENYASARADYHRQLSGEIRKNGTIDNSELLLEKLGDEETREKFLNSLENTFEAIQDLDFNASADYMVENGHLSNSQASFLKETMDNVETLDQLGGDTEAVRTYLTTRFRHSNLAGQFDENEIQVLRLFGLEMLYNVDLVANSNQRERCNVAQAILCGTIATLAAIPAAFVVSLFDQCLANGEPVDILTCAVIVGVTVWALVYRACCPWLSGSNTPPVDPCANVTCPPYQYCNDGNCVNPPPPTSCSNCLPTEQCINNRCVPL